MGFWRYSLAVILVAVAINLIPGLFKEEVRVPPVAGHVEPGWEHVRNVYQELFTNGDDRGSSLGVYHKGKLVVDLRGGFANEKELWPWQENTLARVYSTSKGIGAVSIALLVNRGFIDYHKPVTTYWPEFGANGKEDVTVEMLLSHQSGLAIITSEYNVWDELNNIEKIGPILAGQKPNWKPGTGVGYHALTIGLYMDQLVRHTDPKQRGIQQFFREEIAEPFGIDISFGLPDSEAYRLSSKESMGTKLKYFLLPYVQEFYYAMFLASDDQNVAKPFERILNLINDPEIGMALSFQRPDVNKLWNPSACGYANGASLAKLFGILANGGLHKGQTLMSKKTIEAQTKVIKEGLDKVMKIHISYGRGYTIYQSPKNTPIFGTPGAGGQMAYADPSNKLAIGYATNYHSTMGLKDLRYRTLEKAIYECLD